MEENKRKNVPKLTFIKTMSQVFWSTVRETYVAIIARFFSFQNRCIKKALKMTKRPSILPEHAEKSEMEKNNRKET